MTESDHESLQARIAELEQQVSKLREEELRSPAALIVTSLADGRILQASEEFAELSGYRREELLGRTTVELGLWRDPADRDRAVKRLAAQGGRGNSRFVIRRRDGTPHEAVGQMETLSMGGDQVVITALELQPGDGRARNVREREESLDFILSNAPLILFTTDREGILAFDAGKALASLGIKPGELVGKSIIDLYGALPVQLADGSAISVAEVFRRVMTGEVISCRAELSGIILENWLSPWQDPSGAIGGMIGMSIDVTERSTLEAQLLHARKLEALGRLSGGVAHDFNNMLSVILGYSEILLEEAAEEDPRRAELEEIVAAARRSSELTRQLLAFGRKQVLRPRPLDVGALLARLDRMLRRLIGEHVQVVTRAPKDVPCALADEGQLEQVIVNVALNARDAMPRGGRLYFSVGEAFLAEMEARARQLPAGRYVVLSVGDTGAGMDAETRSHIFEPFFTTKAPGQGTGLGLSTAYGFVRQSGGDIEVESTPGHGTTFRIYLPATEQRAAVLPEASDGHALIGNEAVLVAEDEAMVLHLAIELLRRAGYSVVGAQSAAEALEIASTSQAIDLLLTDVFLGDLPGHELAARIASARPALRTVYMSGYSADEVPEPVVQKPFAAASLLRAVRDALDSRHAPVGDGALHSPPPAEER